MTPEEILSKCAEFNVRLKVVNGKLSPAGAVSLEFVKFSSTLIPYKQSIIDYIIANRPEDVIDPVVAETKAINTQFSQNDRVNRLRLPCIHLKEPVEKTSSCGCAGNILYGCEVFGKCRRAGAPKDDVAVCVDCNSYEPSKKG
jgi:hypothetical protein